MRGNISVQSTLGKGSEFSVELPLVAAAPPDAQAHPPLPDLRGISVLVVTPRPACLTMLQVYLNSAGAKLSAMPDIHSASAMVRLQRAK